jgi:hypothetical protein
MNSEIAFFGLYFNEVIDRHKGDSDKLINVEVLTISVILSSASLKIVSEDLVYQFVRDLYAVDGDVNFLFEFVLSTSRLSVLCADRRLSRYEITRNVFPFVNISVKAD